MSPPCTSRQPSSVHAVRSLRADFVDFQRTGDRRTRDQIVEANVNLARSLAWRYVGRGEEIDDLVQVALLALVQAVDRFDPSRDVTFSTYATAVIGGSLKRHFRDRAWAVRPPRSIQESYLAVHAAREQLVGSLRRTPTIDEIAEYGQWSGQQVREAFAAHDCRFTSSTDATRQDESSDPGSNDADLDRIEDRAVVDDLMQALGARERDIVRMRFFDGMSQSAIGSRFGVSQMHICRLLRSSLDSLRVSAAQQFDPVDNSSMGSVT